MFVFDGHENPDQGSGGTYCSMLHFFGTQSPRMSSCTTIIYSVRGRKHILVVDWEYQFLLLFVNTKSTDYSGLCCGFHEKVCTAIS